ncbi:hypothetical protein A8990_13673, partial [Paenibacillus taihuensis]
KTNGTGVSLMPFWIPFLFSVNVIELT